MKQLKENMETSKIPMFILKKQTNKLIREDYNINQIKSYRNYFNPKHVLTFAKLYANFLFSILPLQKVSVVSVGVVVIFVIESGDVVVCIMVAGVVYVRVVVVVHSGFLFECLL